MSALEEEECKHLIYPASACTICTGKDRLTPDNRNVVFIVARWTARFVGHCFECKKKINIGDPIARDTDERLLCEECSS